MRSTILSIFCIGSLIGFTLPGWAQNPYVSYYEHLTVDETSAFDERFYFWHDDTLEGPVHSNDTISIMENPVFEDSLSTSASLFWEGIGYNPQFVNYEPVFNAPRVALPCRADSLREAAAQQGWFFDSQGGYYAHRLVLNGRSGWTMFWWPMGLPFDSLTASSQNHAVPWDGAIFVDGYLEMYGVFAGRATIGAAGHPDPDSFLGYHCIRLLDDIRYFFADPVTGVFNDTTGADTDMLTIVSESNITIANTWANGRENSAQGSDIVITAALVALGNDSLDHFWGSFSFEDQNEPDPNPTIWEFYNGSYSCPFPPHHDERGTIYLNGSLTQRRRGYVHRSNHDGTGYGKCFSYDNRFHDDSPPYSIPGRHIPVLEPEALFFEDVPPFGSQWLSFELVNSGGTYIDIDSLSVDHPCFTFEQVDSMTLAPGESHLFWVGFEPDIPGTYHTLLTIDLYYGNDLTVPLTGYCVTGVNDEISVPGEVGFSLFPNPFNDELKMVLEADVHQNRTVEIFAVTGQSVLREEVPARQRDFTWRPGQLAGGIYIVRLSGPAHSLTQKIVYLK